MRDLITIIVIIALVFGGSVGISIFFRNSGNEILEVLKDMEKDIDIASIEEKDKKIEELKNLWDKKQEGWIALQYHEMVNNMEDTLIECYNYYKIGDKDEFRISFEKFERAVKDMENREKISFVNVM